MDCIKRNEPLILESSSDGVFKKPFGRAPKKKEKILSEESYISKLQNIIERDFFPNLNNLRDKLDYLEAVENNDFIKLRGIYAKYSEGKMPDFQLPQESPATFDTPDHKGLKETCDSFGSQTSEHEICDNLGSTSKDIKKEDNMSLDAFMSTHTSEDNNSFEQIMEERERKFKAKHPWLFDAEETHNKFHAPNLELPSIEDQQKVKLLALTATVDQDKDTRPKNIENWTYKTYNSVMYVPEGSQLSKEQQIELAKLKKREVLYQNTRFTENPFNEELSQAAMQEASAIQAYKKEGKVGIDGKDLKETPKVNGYSYVHMPSPSPGVNESPLMTWGQVDGTPFQLDGSQTPLLKARSTPGPSYKIPKVSNRDELLLKLAEKASQHYRNRKSKALSAAKQNLSSPAVTRRTSTEKVSSMSPAAQRLLTSKLRTRRDTDIALRASYTASPSYLRDVISTPKTSRNSKALTPSVSRKVKGDGTPNVHTIGLTDNLLQLPTRAIGQQPLNTQESVETVRKTAADFF